MHYSKEQVDSIKARIGSALSGANLNSWQIKFLVDMRSNFQRYGTKTNLSDKQASKLSEIIGPTSVEADGKRPHLTVVKNAQEPWQRPIQYRKQKKSANFLVREWHYFRRRMLFRFSVLAVIFLAGFGFKAIDYLGTRTPVQTTAKYFTTELSKRDFSITDGDTIQLRSERKGTRLIGFNTPETFEPVCSRELALGKQATARLKQLVATAQTVELEKRPCACRPGTEGTNACNYGRSCGVLRADGVDVGDVLISEGLAAPFRCGRTSCPRLPKPWCQ